MFSQRRSHKSQCNTVLSVFESLQKSLPTTSRSRQLSFHIQPKQRCVLAARNEHTANKAHSTWIERIIRLTNETINFLCWFVLCHGNYSWMARIESSKYRKIELACHFEGIGAWDDVERWRMTHNYSTCLETVITAIVFRQLSKQSSAWLFRGVCEWISYGNWLVSI